MIPAVPGLVDEFKIKAKYLLIDEKIYTEHQLGSLKNLVAAVFSIEQTSTPQAMQEILVRMSDWLNDRPDLRRMFALWIRAILKRKPEYSIVLPQVDDLLKLKTMLSDRLEEWAKNYKAEGKAEAEALLLQKLLSKRFGNISVEITEQIAKASQQEIERWFDRAIEANQLSDVFKADGV